MQVVEGEPPKRKDRDDGSTSETDESLQRYSGELRGPRKHRLFCLRLLYLKAGVHSNSIGLDMNLQGVLAMIYVYLHL